MKFKTLLLSLFSVLFCTITYAQTADEILDNYFENTGGIDKWKTMKSMKAIGTAPSPQGEFPFTMYGKSPDKVKIEVDIAGKTMIPQAYDGNTAWTLNPMAGNQAQKLPEVQAKMVAEEASFEDEFINYKEKGHTIALEGTEEIDGVETFKIKMSKNVNNDKTEKVEYHFFDKENYVPIMTRTTIDEGQAAGTTVETYLSDYQETDYGLIMPHFIETKYNGQTGQKIIINAYKINEDISDDVFDFPG
jgi:outer membrane lipoprotein-sorting protein